MKKIVSLLCIIFVALTILSLAVYTANTEHKIDSLRIEYLQRLGEQNVRWAMNLLRVNIGMLAIIGLAFVSVIFIIVKQLREMGKELQTARGYTDKVKAHEREIINIKNTIRDVDLDRRNILEVDILELLRKDLKWPVTTTQVDIIKNFTWRWEIETIDKIKKLMSDSALIEKIERRYRDEIGGFINKGTLLNWCYRIKMKDEKINDLILQEKESKKWHDVLISQIAMARRRARYKK